ncbi:hypothetical protein HG537_0B01100 [Torulaspora globosa]|uniref:Uncharacterized protein n=1 Tax=Torulaspora globosa TaxID=48254 RepID=A0A7H9HNH7_9SACH|nr:hypothetical protein HG537_0B01100 [Torulaspora sp. CBS 2947]
MRSRAMMDRIRKFTKWWQRHFPCDRILAQRITKSTVNSTVAFIFCLIPKVRNHLGTEPAMLPLISVMVHPGRRVSGTIQGAIYCMTGLVFGLAYAIFGRFLAQRCLGSTWSTLSELEQYAMHYKRFEAALAILAVFETLMLFVHGWMRSVSHHYFGIVFPLFLVVHFTFMAPLKESSGVIAQSFSSPFYLGIAMSIFWNLILFPEFGSTFLGNASIDALNEIHKAIDESVRFFISMDERESGTLYSGPPITLSKLFKTKTTISKKVQNCLLVLDECIYEISYSYLSPLQLKPIIDLLKPLNMYINGLVNACQLEFILLGSQQNIEGDVMDIGTNKEILYADAAKLLRILDRLKEPVYGLHRYMSECIYISKLILSYAYDVDLSRVDFNDIFPDMNFPTYNHKKELPEDFNVEEHINKLTAALVDFDLTFREEMIHLDIDLLNPNDEMFLLSSFLMNFKQSTQSVISILEHVKDIYSTRKAREKKGWIRGKSLWSTFLSNRRSFKIWLKGNRSTSNVVTENESLRGTFDYDQSNALGGLAVRRPSNEEDDLLGQKTSTAAAPSNNEDSKQLPVTARDIRDSSFISNKAGKKKGYRHLSYYFKMSLISADKFCRKSKAHFRFGFQVAIALMLASFPMFIPKTRHWYVEYRGTWIGFVCILCLEPSVGGTFWVFFLRAVGVIAGSAWSYLSYVAGVNQTNPYLETVVTVFGAVPGFYFLLGTPYVKAAIIQIISIYIVMLAAILPSSNRGSILISFAKRCLAVGYGGVIALVVQLTFFPIKARDQLNEEIAFVCGCISEMELLYASGLEGESLKTSMTDDRYQKFNRISQSAKSALSRAEAYKGLTRQEPRLKGEYTELENVFTQIIFVQRQIVDRMDNVALLRKQYGSGVIEELNSVVYPYRRQMVASLSNCMRAIQEAFLNKTPLPQFLPSARIAHRRLINMVSRALHNRYRSQLEALKPRVVVDKFRDDESSDIEDGLTMKTKNNREKSRGTLPPHEYALKEKFLSWNASSAATEEVIEYVEELLDLTKILVGINEFKYGFLSRPLYEDWAADAVVGFDNFVKTAGKRKRPVSGSEAGDVNSAISRVEEISSGSTISTAEGEQPVAFNKKYTENSGLNLARIASHKIGHDNQDLPINFKNRTYSIGSYRDSVNQLSALSRKKTLGDADSSYFDEEDTSDDELPLALKKIVSHKSKKH